jgi:nitrogen fixation protein NifU and related proteins
VDDLDELYQEIILDHWKRPRGRGLREPYGGESHQVNPTCGDEITVRVSLDGDTVGFSYEGIGCSISQAAASVLSELVDGRPMAEVRTVHGAFTEMVSGRGEVVPDEEVLGDGVAFAGVAKFPARVKCALLAATALKDAVVRAGGMVDSGGTV